MQKGGKKGRVMMRKVVITSRRPIGNEKQDPF